MVLWGWMGAMAQNATVNPCGPLPNANQLRWQDMEMYALGKS